MRFVFKLSNLFLFIGLTYSMQAFCVSASTIATLETDIFVSEDSVYTRQALLDRFYTERNLLVVFGASSAHMKEQIRTRIQESSWRWRSNLQVKHVDEVQAEDFQHSAVLLVGTPATNKFLSILPESFPLSFRNDGFTFLGKKYQDKDVVTLVHPNHENPQYPLFIVAGMDEESVLHALNDRMRTHDYHVVRNGRRLRLGRFSQDAATLWQLDPEQDQDFEDDIKLVGSTENFRFYTNGATVDHGRLAEIIRKRQENYGRITAFISDKLEEDKLEEDKPVFRYYLYSSLQEKAVITNSMQFAHVDHGQSSVHVALEEGIRGDALNKEASLIVRAKFGKPALNALEDGLGIYLVEEWFGKSYKHWSDRIAHAQLEMPITHLLNNEQYEAASPLIREVLAGAMVSCMIDQWGKDVFVEQYASWRPLEEEWSSLNHMWDVCMETGRARYKPESADSPPLPDTFQKGFNFAHEGYGIVNGYGSEVANEALDKLKSMGTNAISILPYTFMRNPDQTVPFRFANTAGDENDGAIAHASKYAQSIGFTTMVKPQIWLRGSWPGDIEMATPEAWETFFDHYEHWITHYALLSELFDVDILCVGNELSKATMVDEEWWKILANNLRSIYSGRLVYAPNWGEEFESLAFWDAFDYIGLNSYYPLSELDDPTDEDLLKGAKDIVSRVDKVYKKFKKPVLITEIGYPSSHAPWKLPYQEDRRGHANPEHQARCYEAMIEALSGVDWLGGIYWWKWPSYLERGGMQHRGFTPNNKLAEQVVSDWYRSF